MTECVICRSPMKNAFTATVLGQHSVQYLFCNFCGHLRTESPYWLAEAYSAAISAADTGIVWRNQWLAEIVSATIFRHFNPNGVYLDAAGGTGLFVRMMRDKGFDFYWEDKYCENLFARFFEDDGEHRNYSGITAFEVLEHVEYPLTYIKHLLDRTQDKVLLFTTELFEGGPPTHDWWYYAFPTGQHISFYQHRTLEYIAKCLDLNLVSAEGLHLFSKKSIRKATFYRSIRYRRRINNKIRKKLSSLRDADHHEIITRFQGYNNQ